MGRGKWWIGALVLALVLSACTGHDLEVTGLPSGSASDAGDVDAPDDDLLTPVSDLVSLGPARPLERSSITVSLRDGQDRDAVLVAGFRDTPDDGWTYEQAALTSDREHASLAADRGGQLAVFRVEVDAVLDAFDDGLRTRVAAPATSDGTDPVCVGDPAALGDGYTLRAEPSEAVGWCSGADEYTRTVTVVNRRPYALQFDLSGVTFELVSNTTSGGRPAPVADPDTRHPIVTPGGNAVFTVDLVTRPTATLATAADDRQVGLTALHAAVDTLTALLVRVHAAGVPTATDAVGQLLNGSCGTTVTSGSPRFAQDCFSATALDGAFPTGGAFLAPVTATDRFTDVVHERAGPLTATEAERDAFALEALQPTIGRPGIGAPDGIGEVRPADVDVSFNAPVGAYSVFWREWGGAVARGDGEAVYPGSGEREDASVAAYDLGTCQGLPTYRRLAYWFPQHGETWDPAHPTPGHAPDQSLCPS